MPRGRPKGSKNKKTIKQQIPLLDTSFETDAQIHKKLNERFGILSDLVDAAVTGEARALIVSGPAGLGKSYTVENRLAHFDPTGATYSIIRGYVKPTGLYKALWQCRLPGQVLVFDDADSIFFDDVSLNMLKAVCDTTEKRIVSYLADYHGLIDEDSAMKIPKSFEFEGTIIFISNYDFDAMIDRGHKLAPHLQALVSRSHYIDLAMKTKRDYLIRIKQVIDQGLLSARGLTTSEQNEVAKFIEEHADHLRELSLRIAIKIASIRKSKPLNWKNMAIVTCCRNR